jgi:hypothetical protein
MPKITITDEQIVMAQCWHSLDRFVEETSAISLHPWQKILCARLERLADEKGQRILIHAPPQVGKSQIVSKRFPAWLLWHNKLHRIILAAYNQTHALGLIDSAKNSAYHEIVRLSNHPIEWLKSNQGEGSYTRERYELNDAQPSLIGVGLDAGFTGRNADCLIIDDPYPNADAARSEAYNRSVRSFWNETAEPRLMANPDANVVVMFHRYHEHDIAGYLMRRFSDWEIMTFPAIADGNPHDPTFRSVCELLSPFHTLADLTKKQDDDPKTFAGQFQGNPVADGERLFEPDMFMDRLIEPYQCPPLKTWYRGLDTATSDKQSADDSATVKVAYDPNGDLYIRMPKTRKLNPAQLNEWMESIVVGDPFTTVIVEGHNAGFGVVGYLQRQPIYAKLVHLQMINAAHGGKRQRALILADLARRRKVYIVKEGEYEKLLDQLYGFTGSGPNEQDDLIDAITVVQTFLKERKSTYEKIESYNPYNPQSRPSAKKFADFQAKERV